MLSIWQSSVPHVPESLRVLAQVGAGEGLSVPLSPRGPGSRSVIWDRTPEMRGQEEPPLMLPVPHDVKIPDTRPGWGHGPGAHSQDLAMSDPAPAQVLATDWLIRNKIED